MKLSKNSGSSFKLNEFTGTLQAAAGASGDIITITPAAGKKVKLTGLAAAVIENGISVYRGTKKVVNNKSLQAAANLVNVGGFIIGNGMSSGTFAGGGTHVLVDVQGEVNEVIRVVKESGSTGSIIYYSFADGE